MTTVRLAWNGTRYERDALTTCSEPPALLVSYVVLPSFMKCRPQLRVRDWVMDSGAFSAHNSGRKVCLNAYTDTVFSLRAAGVEPVEVFALDVIGDPLASLKNCETMHAKGIPALPTFHYGSPWSALADLAAYPKIALGGLVGRPQVQQRKFIEQCFARVWPKKMHAFGVASERILSAFPFHSADASSWEQAPLCWGHWKNFGKMSVRGSSIDLRSEVVWYLKLEQRLKHRWANEMRLLEETQQ